MSLALGDASRFGAACWLRGLTCTAGVKGTHWLYACLTAAAEGLGLRCTTLSP